MPFFRVTFFRTPHSHRRRGGFVTGGLWYKICPNNLLITTYNYLFTPQPPQTRFYLNKSSRFGQSKDFLESKSNNVIFSRHPPSRFQVVFQVVESMVFQVVETMVYHANQKVQGPLERYAMALTASPCEIMRHHNKLCWEP